MTTSNDSILGNPAQSGLWLAEVVLFATLFLFLFGWKIGTSVDLITLVAVGAAFAWFVIRARALPVPASSVVVAMVGAAGYAALVVAVSGAHDPQVALRSLRALIALVGGIALAGLYCERWRDDALRILMLHVYLAVGLHAIVICAMYVSDGLRAAIYGALGTLDVVNANAPVLLGLRIPGLTYGLASTSILQMSGLCLLPAVLAMNREHRAIRFVTACLVAPLVASVFLTGRSGLALGALLIPLILVGGAVMKRGLRDAGPGVITLVVLLGLGIAFGESLSTLLPDKVAYNVTQATEILVLLDDPSRSPTFQAIAGMYVLPSGDMRLLFGGGSLGRSEMGYIPSDVGYVLLIHAVGLSGLVLTMLPIGLAVPVVWRLAAASPHLALAGVAILATTLVFNFKELALLTRNMWSLQVVIVAAAAVGMRATFGAPPSRAT